MFALKSAKIFNGLHLSFFLMFVMLALQVVYINLPLLMVPLFNRGIRPLVYAAMLAIIFGVLGLDKRPGRNAFGAHAATAISLIIFAVDM
ncbi:MAG: hypothetical protein FWD19_02050, partial [Defluviitaleaceae bacterium]|nr:hypothetical protein [Defluviitaleaceae bacterium]